jgi:hypothetical protein
MTIAIKALLAVFFLVCLADMPYGYYQFVRFAGLVGFAVLAYEAFKAREERIGIVYVGLALLFQPFVKVALGRTVWNVVDVVVAASLLLSLFIDRKRNPA